MSEAVSEESAISEVGVLAPVGARRRFADKRPDAARDRERGESSWLCESAADRQRMLDMDARLAPVRRVALIFLALTAVVMSRYVGLWALAPIGLAGVTFALASRLSKNSDRPEYMLFASWVVSELVIAATVLIAGLDSMLLAWLAIPVVTLSSRFSMHGVTAGVVIAVALSVGVAFAADASAVIDDPPQVIGPVAVVIAVGILSTALMRSDFDHRGEAVIDQLTGMLNRNALARRADELEQQSRVSGEPVGIVVGDLDNFKQVNDTQGHAVGDAVLTQVAYTMRKQLRAFDLAYRLGGEEFLILIPGADAEQATKIAESLRAGIEAQRFEGQAVTMTFGVSTTRHGETFAYQPQFERADASLYEAKRAGRNRVVAAD